MASKKLKPIPTKRKALKSYRVGVRKNSRAGQRLKELWATPEFRERMKRHQEKLRQMHAENPNMFSRAGVPNGFSKATIKPYWDRAHELADKFIRVMKDTGELPEIVVPDTDAGKAEAALHEAFVLAVGPSDQKIKIQAINTVLNFTKSKPESKSKLTLDKAEDFLTEITKDLGA